MVLFLRATLMSLALLWGTPSIAQVPTGTVELTSSPGLPDEAFFSAPHINPTNEELRRAAAPAPDSAIVGLEVGEPAPAYRTLRQAAQAGVNPMARSATAPRVLNAPVKVEDARPLWPAAVAFLVLMFAGFVAIASVATMRRGRAPRKT